MQDKSKVTEKQTRTVDVAQPILRKLGISLKLRILNLGSAKLTARSLWKILCPLRSMVNGMAIYYFKIK